MAKSSLCPSEALQGPSPYSAQKPPTPRVRVAAVLGWEELSGHPSCPTGDAGFRGVRELPVSTGRQGQAGRPAGGTAPWRALGTQGDGCLPPEVLTCDLERLSSPVRVLGDGVFSTLAHTDCVTLDLWASSHSVPPVQAVGGDEATGRFFPAPSAPRERAPGR